MDPWTRFDPPCALKSTSWAFFHGHPRVASGHGGRNWPIMIKAQLTYRSTLGSLPFMVGINQEWQFPMSESAIIDSFRRLAYTEMKTGREATGVSCRLRTGICTTSGGCMEREAMSQLEAWMTSSNRKPLIVRGARQVGKTWLVREFAHRNFGALAHIVFLENEVMRAVFDGSLDPDRLLTAIGAYTGTNPLDGNTLVFLDEVQECPRALTALKMLCEQRPEVPVVAAGSLLGIALSRAGDAQGNLARISWPVGKVEYLNMHPMTFREFLHAVGQGQLAELIRPDAIELVSAMGETYEDLLRSYLFTGGMPEAVQAYVDTHMLGAARNVQQRLLLDYEHDFAKHVKSASETEHIRELWRSIPTQIARETGSNKFIYAQVTRGGRGRTYKDAVSWLTDSGLVTRVQRITRPNIPLRAYEDDSSFKLYLLDVGLLGAALHLDARTILRGNELFTHAKGVYAEQYVCQQLVATDGIGPSATGSESQTTSVAPWYWSADGKRSKGEVDFLYEYDGRVVPLEVKAGTSVKSGSIARFAKEHGITRSLRLSLKGYADQGWIVNYPLYAANLLPLVP